MHSYKWKITPQTIADANPEAISKFIKMLNTINILVVAFTSCQADANYSG